MTEYYTWIKAIHVIAVIAWMAGMLYLPRLFVYHSQATNKETSQTFKTMEYRLLKFIINPAMIVSLVCGLTNAYIYGISNLGVWFHIKMTAVIGLLALHGLFAKWCRNFRNEANQHSTTFYKFVNESVTMLMIICVVMVIVKPFE